MLVSVKTEADGLKRKFAALANADAAVARALNKTLTTVRARTSRAIRAAGYKIRAGDIRAQLAIHRANASNLVADVTASGRPIPLMRYGARAVRSGGGGVSVDVLRGRKLIRGAFLATMPNGHRGVFVRVGSAAHRAYVAATRAKRAIGVRASAKHGLPIIELFGPGVPQAFVNALVARDMEGVARDRFPVVLDQELRFENLRAGST